MAVHVLAPRGLKGGLLRYVRNDDLHFVRNDTALSLRGGAADVAVHVLAPHGLEGGLLHFVRNDDLDNSSSP